MMFRFFKVGGLYHWRVGRVGGSFYLSRRRVVRQSEWAIAIREGKPEIATTLVTIALIIGMGV